MTFLGADLSLTRSGFVAINEAGGISGRNSLQPETKGAARLAEIAKAVVHYAKFYPEVMAFEAPFTASGPLLGAAMGLAELHGAVKAELHRQALQQPYYVAPMTLKKFATGSGKAEKSDIKMAILKKWGLEFKNNDEADAYVLARIAGVIAGKIPAQGYELECVKTVLKSPLNAERAHS